MSAKWWVTLTRPGGVNGTGGQLTANFVQAATAPAKKGDVWGVFGPWATMAAARAAWNDGSYQNHAAAPPGDSSPVVNTIVSGNPNANQGGNTQSGFLPSLTRIAEIILGIGLLLIGLAKLASGTQIGQAAKNIATKAAIL